MRPTVLVESGRNDAEGLPLEHREYPIAELQYDVTDIGRGILGSQTVVAGDRGDGPFRKR